MSSSSGVCVSGREEYSYITKKKFVPETRFEPATRYSVFVNIPIFYIPTPRARRHAHTFLTWSAEVVWCELVPIKNSPWLMVSVSVQLCMGAPSIACHCRFYLSIFVIFLALGDWPGRCTFDDNIWERKNHRLHTSCLIRWASNSV